MRKIAKGAKGNLKDISKQRFGRLIAMHAAYRVRGTVYWYCKCDCGNFTTVRGDVLRGGTTESCGCLSKENAKKIGYANRTHGMTETATYATFLSMRDRCKNKKLQSYKYYGGRGIKVCQGWDTPAGFPDFLKAVGARPSPAHSLDRVKVNGHYSCGKCQECRSNRWTMNVRWAVIEVQASNRRSNRYLTYKGERQTITRWAKQVGIGHATIAYRLKIGWSVGDALTKRPKTLKRILIPVGGVPTPLVEVAREAGVPVSLVRNRLRQGKPLEQILLPPFRTVRPLTYRGATKTLRQHAIAAGINYSTARFRLLAGLPLAEVFKKRHRPTHPS